MSTKKNIAKDLLREFSLMKAQKDKYGAVNLENLDAIPLEMREAIASSLLNDAGLDIENPEHIVAFLCIVAFHLHGEFKRGARKSFPLNDFDLLHTVHNVAANNELLKATVLELVRESDSRLHGIEPAALKQQFDRILTKAIGGKLKLESGQMAQLPRLLEGVRRLSIRPRAIK